MIKDAVPRRAAASAVAQVERAAFELRSGRPVLATMPDAPSALFLATELASRERLDALRGAGGRLHVVLTHQRARTMKIRLYTPEVVRIPYPDWLPAEQVVRIADPQYDLAEPLRGPFLAVREPAPATVAASLRLAKIARLLPSTICADPPEGAPDAVRVAAADVADYDVAAASALEAVVTAKVPLAGAENARITAFKAPDGATEHLAVVVGDPPSSEPVLARLHSECFTGDLLGSLKCDCGQQLRGAIEQIAARGGGVLIYLAQEGRGIGLVNKLRAYALQDQGFDTVEANQRLGFEDDERVFLSAATILRRLGYSRVRLLTNNPRKVAQLEAWGIEVAERVAHAFPANPWNAGYLAVKAEKSGHLLG